ncbi:MAG: secretin N-terminal domain-containing protein [Negativicutes bacterium]|nr:secretin N-terminal domain-containing protein [Negativicutes bacterium]
MPTIKKYILSACLLVCLTISQVSAAGNPVNMNVVNTDVRDVLTALASVGGVNIIADDSVTGKVTIQFNGIPFDTALDLVTKAKGLSYQKIGSVIVVATSEKLTKNFGTIQVIKINYAKADDVKKSLAAIVPGDRLNVDQATNSIVFNGTPSELEQLTSTLAELDIPYQQISLEAQVVSITKTASNALGFDWAWSSIPDSSASTTTTTTTTSTTTNSTYPGAIRFGRSASGQPYQFSFQATLSALVSKGDAKILAKPNVTTINGKEASILIGDRIPISTQTTTGGVTSTTITYVDAGIKLQYTPRINADGLITATVHTEVSTPTLVSSLGAYRITTRSADTNVRVRDGETMIIGGLIGKNDSYTKNAVPFLSELPVLGKLFQSVVNSSDENEVVIFLTARIVKDGGINK